MLAGAGKAPYCQPKLQAIIAKIQGGEKSQADWVKEMKEEMDGPGNGAINEESTEVN